MSWWKRRWWIRPCERTKRRFGCESWFLDHFLEASCIGHHVTSRETFMCLEKNHFPFRWNALMFSDTHKRIWTHYKRTKSTIIGMSIGNDHYLDLGWDSRDSVFWTHVHPKDTLGLEKRRCVSTHSRKNERCTRNEWDYRKLNAPSDLDTPAMHQIMGQHTRSCGTIGKICVRISLAGLLEERK